MIKMSDKFKTEVEIKITPSNSKKGMMNVY